MPWSPLRGKTEGPAEPPETDKKSEGQILISCFLASFTGGPGVYPSPFHASWSLLPASFLLSSRPDWHPDLGIAQLEQHPAETAAGCCKRGLFYFFFFFEGGWGCAPFDLWDVCSRPGTEPTPAVKASSPNTISPGNPQKPFSDNTFCFQKGTILKSSNCVSGLSLTIDEEKGAERLEALPNTTQLGFGESDFE